MAFVATPAKFLAPSLPLAQTLDVGRWTFLVLSLIEWALAAAFLGFVLVGRSAIGARWRGVLLGLLGVAVVLSVETFSLRPILDARVLEIIRGDSVPQSALHEVYIGLEFLKFVLLLAAGSLCLGAGTGIALIVAPSRSPIRDSARLERTNAICRVRTDSTSFLGRVFRLSSAACRVAAEPAPSTMC